MNSGARNEARANLSEGQSIQERGEEEQQHARIYARTVARDLSREGSIRLAGAAPGWFGLERTLENREADVLPSGSRLR